MFFYDTYIIVAILGWDCATSDMEPSKKDSGKKTSSSAPPQVVSKTIPALGLFIASAHQSAIKPTTVAEPKLPPCDILDSGLMDEKFSVTPKKHVVKAATPSKLQKSGWKSSMSELNRSTLQLPAPECNLKWSAEAFSIFEGMLNLVISCLLCIGIK